MDKFDENKIFEKGIEIKNDYFTGKTWLNVLVQGGDIFNCPIYNVTFEQGARNNWHKHPGGQILLVTDGKGYYQEEGKPATVIRKGDVVKIPFNVKHWHGASEDSGMSHIAITTNPQVGEVEWLEPVSDEEYNGLFISV